MHQVVDLIEQRVDVGHEARVEPVDRVGRRMVQPASGQQQQPRDDQNRGAPVMLLYPIFGYRFIRPFSPMPK